EVHHAHRSEAGLRHHRPGPGGFPLFARPGHARPKRQGPDVPPGEGRSPFAAAPRRQGPGDDPGRSDRSGPLRFRASVSGGRPRRRARELKTAAEAAPTPMAGNDQNPRVSRSFRNDDAELRPLSEWFRDFAREGGVAESRALDFELCLNELVTNIIHYAYADRGRHEIRVALERDGEEIRAILEDDGRPFNPLEKEAPPIPHSLDEAGIGGWGIPIVLAYASDISYERTDGRNRLTIVSRGGSNGA